MHIYKDIFDFFSNRLFLCKTLSKLVLNNYCKGL